MLNHIHQEFPRPASPYENIMTINHRGIKALASRKRQYEKRKAAGMCAYFGCAARPETDRKYCQTHLQAMCRRQKRIVTKRKGTGLCVYCGKRPQFWSVRCVICRQRFVKDLLPFGARRALRLYRQAEKQFQIDQLQVKARFAVRKLLLSVDIKGDHAKALRLYAGLDNGEWRTYSEVGALMKLSKERVRQLLQPSKIILTRMLDDKVPWKPLREYESSQSKGVIARNTNASAG